MNKSFPSTERDIGLLLYYYSHDYEGLQSKETLLLYVRTQFWGIINILKQSVLLPKIKYRILIHSVYWYSMGAIYINE